MNRRDSFRRRKPSRSPLRRYLLVCEGIKTEKTYFNDLRQFDKAPIQIEFIAGAVPKTLVEMAVRKKFDAQQSAARTKDPNEAFDEVWVICDIDEHPNVPEALIQARDNGIKVAISNPCFELWALLHFQDQSAHIHRRRVQSLCREYMPGYTKKLPCAELMKRYDDARRRADILRKWHAQRGTAGNNPSTNVDELVAGIRAQRAGWH